MSSIVTFYSYKGGVGRSMALANIAFELARRNKKVLMVDWDLEAPGLERYFSNFTIDKTGEGLLPLLLEFRDNKYADYKDYMWSISTSFAQPLYLLHSGREKDPQKYSKDLEGFKWEDFFILERGGTHLENLRNQWLKEFDVVLIDSRTGLSDASGVCTIMLPDIVIPMFTANYQSLFGIKDIVDFIQSARQRLSVDRMALTILPVPSRFGTRVEFKQSQEWLDRIADILKDCFSDWLPKWIEPKYVIEQIKIPQVDYFSFGEKLAVIEQGTSDPESMGFIYAKLADFLASDFSDIETFIGSTYYHERKAAFEKLRQVPNNVQVAENKYSYDLFISYPRSVYQWVREVLLPVLTEYLSEELGYTPQIFIDVSELSSFDNLTSTIKTAIEKTKVFLFIVADTEKDDTFNNQLIFAEAMQKTVNTNIIVPVLFRKKPGDYTGLPESIKNRQITDLSAYTTSAIKDSTRLNVQFASTVEKLSGSIAESIRELNNPNSKPPGSNDIRLEIESLSYAYENIRESMPSGNSRTRLMQDIVEKMKSKADETALILPELVNDTSPGKRLAAIATLQEKPNIEYLDWLADHVGDIEKPFVGYQASVSLYTAARSLGTENRDKVSQVLDKALGNLNRYDFIDPNQLSVLNSAKMELGFKF